MNNIKRKILYFGLVLFAVLIFISFAQNEVFACCDNACVGVKGAQVWGLVFDSETLDPILGAKLTIINHYYAAYGVNITPNNECSNAGCGADSGKCPEYCQNYPNWYTGPWGMCPCHGSTATCGPYNYHAGCFRGWCSEGAFTEYTNTNGYYWFPYSEGYPANIDCGWGIKPDATEYFSGSSKWTITVDAGSSYVSASREITPNNGGSNYEVFWLEPVPPGVPVVVTGVADPVADTSATLNGNVTNTGGENPDKRVLEWGTSPGSYSWSHDCGSGGTGSFSYNVTGLNPETTYYYRAKAHNSTGWGYGAEKNFTTEPLGGGCYTGEGPANCTGLVCPNGADCGANCGIDRECVTNCECGLCYSCYDSCPLGDVCCQSNGWPWACYDAGTILPENCYCGEASYCCWPDLPVLCHDALGNGPYAYSSGTPCTGCEGLLIVTSDVDTNAAANIATSSATIGGNLTYVGNENPDKRVLEWGTSPGSYLWSYDAGGGGTGVFSYNLTGLTPGTDYYFRAKVHNSAGWGYGLPEKSFKTDVSNHPPKSPKNIKTENQVNPTEVANSTPVLSAEYDDPDEGDTAAYYQAQVREESKEITKFEYYDTGWDVDLYFYDKYWRAQTFTPSTNHKITSVKLILAKCGTPVGNVVVGIRATDAGGKPTGSDLTSGSILASNVTSAAGSWFEIPVTEYELSASTKYAIIIRNPEGDGSNYINVGGDWAAATYPAGIAFSSDDYSGSWQEWSDRDLEFEEWGRSLSLVWDSTKRSCSVPRYSRKEVTYGGSPLALDGKKYYQRWKFWDSVDNEGFWSDGTDFWVMHTHSNVPLNIKTEGQINPTGIVNATPLLSAEYDDPNAGDTATYYQVQVPNPDGGDVLDQQQTLVSHNNRLRSSSEKQKWGQGFKPSGDGSLGKITLRTYRIGNIAAGKKVWVEICEDSLGNPGTKIGESEHKEAADMSDSNHWEEFVFSSPPNITANTQYHIVYCGDYDYNVDNNMKIVFKKEDVYPYGTFKRYNGSSWIDYEIDYGVSSDMTFKQYYTPPLWDSEKTACPSPAPVAGQTDGSEREEVAYEGSPLPLDGKKYYQRWKFWDDKGAEGPWSDGTDFWVMERPPNAPLNIKTENQTNPTGITNPAPLLSAEYDDPDVGDTATYYQVQVTDAGIPGASGDTGYKSPSATGENYNSWSNPVNAFSSDNQYAFQQGGGPSILDVALSWNGGASFTSEKTETLSQDTDSIDIYGGPADIWGRTWSSSEFNNANFRVYIEGSLDKQDYYNFDLDVPDTSNIDGIGVKIKGHYATTSPLTRYVDHIQVNVYYSIMVGDFTSSFLDQQETGDASDMRSKKKQAQAFVPTKNNVSKVELVVSTQTGGQDLTVEIYQADVNHHPIGEALVSKTWDLPELPGDWETFTFDFPVSVTPGQEYCVVVSTSAVDFAWYYSTSGSGASYETDGTWNDYSTAFRFKEYAIVWDSTKTSCSVARFTPKKVTYGGSPLPLDGKKYYQRWKFWDDKGAEGPWSDGTDFWVMALPFPPSNLHDTDRTENSISLAWVKGEGAEETEIRYQKNSYPSSPSSGNRAYKGSGTSTTVINLDSVTEYYFRAWSYSNGVYSTTYSQDTAYTNPGGPTNLSATPVSQTEIDLIWTKWSPACSYCSVSAENTSDDWIAKVQFNTGDKSSDSTNYSDYTSAVFTDVEAGNSYTLIVTIGMMGGSWNQCTRAFFDWNQDCDFDDSGESIDIGCCSADGCAVSQNITIPGSVVSGNIRMRVFEAYNGYPGPCESVTYGEPEDYLINVTGGTGVSPYSTKVMRKVGSYPTNVTDGTQAYFDAGTTKDDTGLPCGTHYYYRAWTHDSNSGYYSNSSSSISTSTFACNNPPTAINLALTEDDYCRPWSAYFSWEFDDPDSGDTQSAYQIQIDNSGSGFPSPEVDTCIPAPGTCSPGHDSNEYAPPAGTFDYQTDYYWRVKVWDNSDTVSDCGFPDGWCYPTPAFFPTPSHAWPNPNFTFDERSYSVGEKITFTDNSWCYKGGKEDCTAKSGITYTWDFDYDGTFSTSTTYEDKASTAWAFSKSGRYVVRLRVTDDLGTCPYDKEIRIGIPLPEWKEIAPY